MDKPVFESEHTYTRREIQEVLGGDPSSIFPAHQGRVICCCIPKPSHPDAPEVILITRERKMIESAKKSASQREALPVFIGIRQQAAGWVYQGEFVAERYVDNPAEIAPLVKRTGRTNIAGVLFLKRIVP